METRSLGVWLHAKDAPRDRASVGDAILRFYDRIGEYPDRINVDGQKRLSNPAFKRSTLQKKVVDTTVLSVSLWSDPWSRPRVNCDLRWRDPVDRRFERLSVDLQTPMSPIELTPAVRAFIEDIVGVYPIAHGFVTGFDSLAYAALECLAALFSPFEIDEASRKRLGEDKMLDAGLSTKLRRLYPITIIGSEIWSRLPAMPAVEPVPVVEDIGDCKMLTVWPELVGPRDPAFLAGTVELRRWLWPYTIQNPADAPELG